MNAADLLGIGSGLPAWPMYACAALLLLSAALLYGVRRYEAALMRSAEMGEADD